MKRVEIQKDILKNKIKNNEQYVSDVILKYITKMSPASDVIELGGMGFASEVCALAGHNISLVEENVLAFDYRKNILPESKVCYINVNPERLNFSKPVFDYVFINDLRFFKVAKLLAKKGIINLITEEFIEIE